MTLATGGKPDVGPSSDTSTTTVLAPRPFPSMPAVSKMTALSCERSARAITMRWLVVTPFSDAHSDCALSSRSISAEKVASYSLGRWTTVAPDAKETTLVTGGAAPAGRVWAVASDGTVLTMAATTKRRVVGIIRTRS